MTCPLCRSEVSDTPVFRRERVPAVNNRVGADVALGTVTLVACPACGFVFNRTFERSLVVYDHHYDATRSHSRAFLGYLDDLVGRCAGHLEPGWRVLELGCGDGHFLSLLQQATKARCTGFDHQAPVGESRDGLTFHDRLYDPAVEEGGFDALILRHVLEHLPRPLDFLERLLEGGALTPGGVVIAEVPDLDWILRERAWFDVTYEHCNYFSAGSLPRLLARAGCGGSSAERVFGDQYLLCVGRWTGDTLMAADAPSPDLGPLGARYEADMALVGETEGLCIWGCSGKGVMFAAAAEDRHPGRIRAAIDLNPAKQGHRIPPTRLTIDPPERLKTLEGPLTVLAMNPFYRDEIAATIDAMGVEAEVKTP